MLIHDCCGTTGTGPGPLTNRLRMPVSRARSSPVPGVVAYFRPSYAAGQKYSRARSSRRVAPAV